MSRDYPIIISPLSDEEGGGFVGVAPDLVGCMSDGETQEEALANTHLAIIEWLATHERRGLTAPEPGSAGRREREKHERLLRQLKDIAGKVEHMNLRLEELETSIREIEAKLEHEDAWHRFSEITGLAAVPVDSSPRLI